VSKRRLAAKLFSDWMKRQSPALAMNVWIAHGPASHTARGWSSSPSFTAQSAERNAKSGDVRYLNITGSAG
jgi:hypothetical protein